MNENELKNYWENNADAWTDLSRKGYDKYRNLINTPAFLKILPPVKDLKGIDVGCGEGHNTQRVAESGAEMTGIDISLKFIQYARERVNGNGLKMSFIQASAFDLPFDDSSFDFAISTMAFMDFPEQHKAMAEVYRVLKKGGFFQFSISHPIFSTPKWKWIFEDDKRAGIMIGDYFKKISGDIEEWTFGAAPQELKDKYEKFKIPRFNMTLSEWFNLLIDTGFTIERVEEPHPDEETIKNCPYIEDASLVPYFLIIRSRKV